MDFFNTASKFLFIVWEFVLKFFDYLVNISFDIKEFFNFIFSVVLELPSMFITIFNNLPDFMCDGLSFAFTGISIIFILKIVKMIRDITI